MIQIGELAMTVKVAQERTPLKLSTDLTLYN
jgi:hypothetical protein